VEGPGKWSAPGPTLALGGPGREWEGMGMLKAIPAHKPMSKEEKLRWKGFDTNPVNCVQKKTPRLVLLHNSEKN